MLSAYRLYIVAILPSVMVWPKCKLRLRFQRSNLHFLWGTGGLCEYLLFAKHRPIISVSDMNKTHDVVD